MAGRVQIIDRDRGWRDLEKRIAQSRRGAFVLVGVQGDKAAATHSKSKGKPRTVVEIATIHEFGATVEGKDGGEVAIPERSFIRATIDEQHDKLQRKATLLGRGVIAGSIGQAQALELLGQDAVGKIKQKISDRIPPPNSPITIARKGSDVPLIDSGQLRGSITHKREGA